MVKKKELQMPLLVISCALGLLLAPDTLTSVRQLNGSTLQSTGFLASDQWCNYQLQQCYPHSEQGCSTDECVRVQLIYAPECSKCIPTVVSTSDPAPLSFWSTSPSGDVQTGAWAGPCDITLNGVISSEDYFAFLASFLSHNEQGDFDLSGQVDSQDFFSFLNLFFGN